ncbi:MAG TPA: hypothetical protein VND15_01220 [Candidatus Acidoferrales bacterium]|nr:hypothetical protein [Candidatus Acidoferrales bacterium]
MSEWDSWFNAQDKKVAKNQSEADLNSTPKMLLRTMDPDRVKAEIKTLVLDMLNSKVSTVDHCDQDTVKAPKVWDYLINSWINQGLINGSGVPLEGRLWFAGRNEINIFREAIAGVNISGFDGEKVKTGLDECSAKYGLFRVSAYNSLDPDMGNMKEFNIHMWLSKRVASRSVDKAIRALGKVFECNAVTVGLDEPTITWRLKAE